MFAILGEIEFEVAGGLTGMDWRSSADWAEHQLIQGKPLLEWIGEGLDEYSLAITLHSSLGDPEKRLRELRQAKANHEPLAFVLGTGDYLGAFVLSELSTTVQRATSGGRLHSATLAMSLREYTGKFTRKPLRPGLIDASKAGSSLQADGSPGLQTQTAATPSTAQQVLSQARSAGNILRASASLYQTARSSSPLSALNQVPQLLNMTGRAIAPLQGLGSAAGLLDGGADLVMLSNSMLQQVNQGRLGLNPIDVDTVIDKISASGAYVDTAIAQLDGASSSLSSLAASVITRRV